MSGSKPETWNGEPIPYDESIEFLRASVTTSGPRAGAAFCALAERPEPEAMAVLIDLTRSSDQYLRMSAVEAIAINPCGKDAAEIVLSLLHDGSGFVVRAALRAAAALRLASAHDRVRELIEATEEATRLSALQALASLWEPSDFEGVFAVYLHDRSDRVRKEAAWTLNDNVGPKNWDRLFLAWSRDPIPRHRVWACSIAERFPTRSTLSMLIALSHDPDGHVRGAAGRAERVINGS